MSIRKVKLSLKPGESYVVADTHIWEDLVYTLTQVANQWEKDSGEYNLWVEYIKFFELNYKLNLVEQEYEEEEGWN